MFTAATDAFTSLGLDRADFPAPLGLSRVRDLVTVAAKVIAVGDKVPAHEATIILRPFAEVGITAARAVIESRARPSAETVH